MKQKPKNPYNELLIKIRALVVKFLYPERKLMWRYPADKINTGWTLGDLAERVQAAEQIGFDVVLVWNGSNESKGLEVWYRKKVNQNEIDYRFR